MARTSKMRAKMVKWMETVDEPKSFHEIMDWINQNTANGTTPAQLGNVLAKFKEFHQWGWCMTDGMTSGKYKLTVWILTSRIGQFVEYEPPEDGVLSNGYVPKLRPKVNTI